MGDLGGEGIRPRSTDSYFDSATPQFLLFSQQRYTRELSEQGLRQPKEILLFATFTIEPGKATTTDMIERMIASLVESYKALKGRKSQLEEVRYQHVLTQGFKAGYLHWE